MKYILYKTTNLINNYIYIGVHKTQDPFTFDKYLGNGIYTNKPYTYKQAKTCFQQAVNQYGIKNFNRELLSIYKTPEEAYAAEALIVNDEFLARSDVYNMIRGGIINNVTGRPVWKYDINSGKLIQEFKSIEDAARNARSNSATIFYSIKFKFQVKGFIYSFDKYEIIDLSDYNFKEKIKVYRYFKNGKFDREFDSISNAGENTLDTSAAYIQKAAILGYIVKDTYYFSFYKCESYDKARTIAIKNRSVYKYDSNGNYWSLEKLEYFNVPVKRTSKKVAKLDEEGNILQIWDSSNLCAKEVGTAVKNVLRGEYEKHKGFKYKYIE